jgi:sugar lactone lactonase YvrE
LDGIPATKGEEGFELKVDGRPLVEQKTGQPPVINCDGIALDSADGYVYFRALTAHTLYRIKTVDLRNLKFSPQEMEAKIEKVAETPACDGMMMGRDGNLYLTDLEHAAVISLELVTGKISTMVADPQFLLWPDTLAIGQDDGVYVSASQIENSPRFNNGVDVRKKPYCVYKVVRGPLPAH